MSPSYFKWNLDSSSLILALIFMWCASLLMAFLQILKEGVRIEQCFPARFPENIYTLHISIEVEYPSVSTYSKKQGAQYYSSLLPILCSESGHHTKQPLCEILFLSVSKFLAHNPQRIQTVRTEFRCVICRNGTDYEQSFEMFYCERWNFTASLLVVAVCFLSRTRLLVVGTSSLVYAGHPSWQPISPVNRTPGSPAPWAIKLQIQGTMASKWIPNTSSLLHAIFIVTSYP